MCSTTKFKSLSHKVDQGLNDTVGQVQFLNNQFKTFKGNLVDQIDRMEDNSNELDKRQ